MSRRDLDVILIGPEGLSRLVTTDPYIIVERVPPEKLERHHRALLALFQAGKMPTGLVDVGIAHDKGCPRSGEEGNRGPCRCKADIIVNGEKMDVGES